MTSINWSKTQVSVCFFSQTFSHSTARYLYPSAITAHKVYYLKKYKNFMCSQNLWKYWGYVFSTKCTLTSRISIPLTIKAI